MFRRYLLSSDNYKYRCTSRVIIRPNGDVEPPTEHCPDCVEDDLLFEKRQFTDKLKEEVAKP